MSIYGLQRYLGIEEDFLKAQYYVSFENTNTYSEFFTREIILLGAEIEAAFKKLCNQMEQSLPGCISDYKEAILKKYPGILNVCVVNKQTNKCEKPFAGWDKGRLEWWSIYTNVKHNLVDEKATLGSSLTMLQAYELLIFCIAGAKGDFTVDYLEMPKLFIPDFKPGIRMPMNLKIEYTFKGNDIVQKLRRNEHN